MAKEETYLAGTEVRIKDPGEKPDGWNTDMMPLIGKTAFVMRSNGHPGHNRYRYKLTGWDWSWRHCDLEPLGVGKLNPNIAFMDSKHANK